MYLAIRTGSKILLDIFAKWGMRYAHHLLSKLINMIIIPFLGVTFHLIYVDKMAKWYMDTWCRWWLSLPMRECLRNFMEQNWLDHGGSNCSTLISFSSSFPLSLSLSRNSNFARYWCISFYGVYCFLIIFGPKRFSRGPFLILF